MPVATWASSTFDQVSLLEHGTRRLLLPILPSP